MARTLGGAHEAVSRICLYCRVSAARRNGETPRGAIWDEPTEGVEEYNYQILLGVASKPGKKHPYYLQLQMAAALK